MFLRSEHLFLRPRWPEDRDELMQLAAHDWVAREVASLDWLRDSRGEADRPDDARFPRFVITVPALAQSAPVGCIGLSRHERGAQLGFWIVDAFRGQGYASEAVSALLPLAAMLGHDRIIAEPYADDAASTGVIAKAGLCATGEQGVRFSKGRGIERATSIHEIALGGAVMPGEPLAA